MKSDKAKDIAYSIVKAGMGAVPIAGSAAIELFTYANISSIN